MNEEEEALIMIVHLLEAPKVSYIQSEANSSDFSDIEGIDNPDGSSSHSSFKRLSALAKRRFKSAKYWIC